MTHVPLKIEAEFAEKILTTCGDSLDLIKRHQMILSDMTGVTGFLFRLEEARDKFDKKKFKLYHEAYEKIAKQKIDNPIKFLKEKLENLTKEELEIIKLRNKKFVEVINQSRSEKIAIVLGARHMEDLAEQLKVAGHEVAKFPEIEQTLPNNGDL